MAQLQQTTSGIWTKLIAAAVRVAVKWRVVKRVRSLPVSGEKFSAMVEESLLSQDAFARAVGVSRSLVQMKSKPGVHALDRGSLQKISVFLRLSPNDVSEKLRADSASKPARRIIRVSPEAYEGLKHHAAKFAGVEEWLEYLGTAKGTVTQRVRPAAGSARRMESHSEAEAGRAPVRTQ